MYEYFDDMYGTESLTHHGVKGMHWGVRRYQNYDGTRIGAKKRVKKAASSITKSVKRAANYTKTNVRNLIKKGKAAKKEYNAKRLDRAIASGNAKVVSKYVSKMSDKEIADVNNRLKNINSIKAMSAAHRTSLKKVMDSMSGNLASATRLHKTINNFKQEFKLGEFSDKPKDSGASDSDSNSKNTDSVFDIQRKKSLLKRINKAVENKEQRAANDSVIEKLKRVGNITSGDVSDSSPDSSRFLSKSQMKDFAKRASQERSERARAENNSFIEKLSRVGNITSNSREPYSSSIAEKIYNATKPDSSKPSLADRVRDLTDAASNRMNISDDVGRTVDDANESMLEKIKRLQGL